MLNKPTNEIEELLSKMKPEELDGFFMDNTKELADDKKAFYYYMKNTLEDKRIRLKDVYSFAGISETYGEKIIQMNKHTKNRDLIIRLCVAGHFTVIETNRALKLYGMKPLYVKDKRDACLTVAINNRKYDLDDIDDILINQGYPKLSIEEKD